MSDSKWMTKKEAAEELEIKQGTLRTYIRRKYFEKKGSLLLRADVLHYKAHRKSSRNGGKRSVGVIRRAAIYRAIVQFYLDNGHSPILSDIAEIVGIAKSGIHRYLPDLASEGKIEIVAANKHIMLKGLPNLIKKLVKETYVEKA